VYKLLGDLASSLSEEGATHVLTKLSAISHSDFNPNVLILLNSFGFNSKDESSSSCRLLCTRILWELVQDVNPSTRCSQKDVLDAASTALSIMLRGPAMVKQRAEFIAKCVENVATSASNSLSSLGVLKSIITACYNRKSMSQAAEGEDGAGDWAASKAGLLRWLDKEKTIVDVVLHDLLVAKDRFVSKKEGIITEFSFEIRERLSFLSVLLSDSTLILSRDQMLSLWDNLVISVDAADSDVVLRWIGETLPKDIHSETPLLYTYDTVVGVASDTFIMTLFFTFIIFTHVDVLLLVHHSLGISILQQNKSSKLHSAHDLRWIRCLHQMLFTSKLHQGPPPCRS
jgi:hypothetical protein